MLVKGRRPGTAVLNLPVEICGLRGISNYFTGLNVARLKVSVSLQGLGGRSKDFISVIVVGIVAIMGLGGISKDFVVVMKFLVEVLDGRSMDFVVGM